MTSWTGTRATCPRPPSRPSGRAWNAASRWAGSGHTEVADRIEEYAALGIDEFILSGYPHLEEAYWFGEGVLPELRRRGRWSHPAGDPGDAPAVVPFAGMPLTR